MEVGQGDALVMVKFPFASVVMGAERREVAPVP
jgi:hypothetical protein